MGQDVIAVENDELEENVDTGEKSGVRAIPFETDLPDLTELLDERRSVPPPLPQVRKDAIDFDALLHAAVQTKGDDDREFFSAVPSIPAVAPQNLLRTNEPATDWSIRANRSQLTVIAMAVVGCAVLAGVQTNSATATITEAASPTVTVLDPVVISVSVERPAAEPVMSEEPVEEPAAIEAPAPAAAVPVQAERPETAIAPTPIKARPPVTRPAAVRPPPTAASPAAVEPVTAPVETATAEEPATEEPAAETTPVEAPAAEQLPATPARDEVLSAMRAIQPAINRCAQGMHGSAEVAITVAPSGRVRSALVTTGQLKGTPAGSCIARAVRQARFPRFSQASFSFNYPFAF